MANVFRMWQTFFAEAGIPANIANRYAKAFEENRITKGMLGDIDKTTLSELGVKAVGDQIAILRRIKDGPPIQNNLKALKVRLPITGPSQSKTSTTSPVSAVITASEARRGRPPPDSHEIYHIRMPTGATRKTQDILQRAEELRTAGLLKRAHSGVRQGGKPVNPISKDPVARRLALHNRLMQQEVSSSTDGFSERTGIRGMYSDRADRVQSGRIVKKSQHLEGKLLSQALHSAVNSSQGDDQGPRIRVRLPANAPTYKKLKATVSAPRTAVRMGVGASLIGQQRRKQKLTKGGTTLNVQTSIRDRVKFKGNMKTKNARPNVKILFDEDEGEMNQEMVDEEAETGYAYQDTEEWDQMNEGQEDEVEYAEGDDDEATYDDDQSLGRGSIFDRIRI